MARAAIPWRVFFLACLAGLVLAAPGSPQVRPRTGPREGSLESAPRPEPVGNVRFLMRNINGPYFRSLETQLRKRPANDEAWAQLRDQALLIAENGNLLMLRRAPSGKKEDWLERDATMRGAALTVSRAADKQDYAGCRARLISLASVCDDCHKAYLVEVRVNPFGDSTGIKVPELPALPAVPKVPDVPPVPPVPRVPG
jgi:hypothetical protein